MASELLLAPSGHLVAGFDLLDVREIRTVVRPGTLFCCGGVEKANRHDLVRLTGLGLRSVIDLRTEPEVRASGEVAVIGTEVFHHPLPDLRGIDLVDAAAGSICSTAAVLSEPTAVPALVHSTNGRNRTDAAVAIVLALLGHVVDEARPMLDAIVARHGSIEAWADEQCVDAAAVEQLRVNLR